MASRTIQTPAGPFTFIAHGKTVIASGFTDSVDSLIPLIHPELRRLVDADAELDIIEAATRAYFDGDIDAIDSIDVEQHSGAFIDVAWKTLRQVPGGAPVTYTQLAEDAGRPAAVRAAAQACARNAVALYVPCHRVVRTDGSLGGYRYGLDVKRWLIAHEAVKESAAA
ncbi:MAG TPA: methylated-DNA--[protein]-cysteine S-methyltransferase [Micromonosporaceae bacterium]|jgi:methylated-DNA-[protein]-cysteine S-methyltransferase